MANTILFKRGLSANLPATILEGEGIFTLDTHKFYIGATDGTPIEINPTYGTAADLNVGTAAGDIPVLGIGGKLPESAIPKIAVTDTFVVKSEAEQLALDAQVGDIAIRTDINRTFILTTADPADIANWHEISAAGYVTSVAGKTGDIVLVATDITDLEKILELKANLISPGFTGVPTAPTAALNTKTTQLATTAYVVAEVADKIAIIDGGTF